MLNFGNAIRSLILLSFAAGTLGAAEVQRTEANNGNLIMEDIPPIPAE